MPRKNYGLSPGVTAIVRATLAKSTGRDGAPKWNEWR